jgi:hypothetical protein
VRWREEKKKYGEKLFCKKVSPRTPLQKTPMYVVIKLLPTLDKFNFFDVSLLHHKPLNRGNIVGASGVAWPFGSLSPARHVLVGWASSPSIKWDGLEAHSTGITAGSLSHNPA